ncbi:hypothetical protein SLEP1_g47821 [Rubroshorea leprosula]|uniref:Uncharacterized protein n=1 Tax=Rubroshorea leprosula TaxID=152421 RepID=A0AAV5LSS4_9ROSI|nr:hypothetical protein SLEP1_g47821 [Rubroshorea leprosula]
MTRKGRKNSRAQIEITVTPDFNTQDGSMVRELAKDLSEGTLSLEVLECYQQLECCKASAGGNESVRGTCPVSSSH